MPVPAAIAAQTALAVVRTRRGRQMLLAVAGGILLGLALIVLVLVSSVGALVGSCQQAVAQASPSTSSPSGSPGASPSPAFVSQEWSGAAGSDIPSDYLPIYEKAAKEYGLDAAILAAIGKIETDHGRLDAPGVSSGENFAGAGGSMQFLADTWVSVGVDGNGDGKEDRYEPEDAIPGAANYLQLEGAPQDYHSAILAYNHAEWYYQDVIAQAEKYRATGGGEGEKVGSSPSDTYTDANPTFLATLLSPLALRDAHAAEGSGSIGNPGETDYQSAEIDTLKLINDYRKKNGLKAVQLSDNISTAAAHYAHDMAKYDAYGVPEAHISGPTDYYFEGATLTDRMNEDGYQAARYGENIAAGQSSPQEVFDSWRNSPPHNEMMLNGEMTVIGIGLVESPQTSYGEFWVTDFGSDADDTTRPVPEAGGGSSKDTGGPSGGFPSGGSVQGNSRAVFPLPKQYLDDYDDTWGAARGHGGHEGTDLFAPDNTQIYSITDGKVVPVSGADGQGWNQLGGWTLMIEASESVGPIQAGDTMYYAHQVEPSPLKIGETVKAGDVIGKVGSTGEGSPGAILPDGRGKHLHLGWYDPTGSRAEAASGAMNPYPLLEWLRQNGGTATGTGGGGSGVALGAPEASLPPYCQPLQALGILPSMTAETPEPQSTEPDAQTSAPGRDLGLAATFDGTQPLLYGRRYLN